MTERSNLCKYNYSFARQVYELENGSYVKLCMQCGLCVVSCATRQNMDYSPRKLFQLIKIGKKDEVLCSNTIWLCTSCLMCKVRCPRGIPIVNVMHDLKKMALEMGYANYPQSAFYRVFWQEIMARGRMFEAELTVRYYLKQGLGEIKKAFKMKDVGINMLKHRRLPLFPPRSIKGKKDLRKIVEKARVLNEKGG